MSMALVSMSDMQQMAKAMASSGLFGVKTPDQALALMLVAQAQGISPATACVDFDVIQGKPAMTARAMLARFQQAGGTIKWLQYTDDVCEAAFSHPQCPDPINIKWTMKDATRAGLTGKDNWKKYPRQMLSSRVMSEGVDRCYPAASGGFYPPEVVQDFQKEKNITPSSGIEEQVSEERRGELQELADKVRAWMAEGSLTDAFLEIDNAALDAEEKIYIWTLFDSKVRRQLKEEGERQRLKQQQKTLPAPDVISDAQKKRLEARIHELGLDREAVKMLCKARFQKEHFAELTLFEYDTIDQMLEGMVVPSAPAQITDDDVIASIAAAVKKKDFDAAWDLCRSIVDVAKRNDTEARINKAMEHVQKKAAA